MAFKLFIEPLAKVDIQSQINYYNSKQKGLGKRFHNEVKTRFSSIKSNSLRPHSLPSPKNISGYDSLYSG